MVGGPFALAAAQGGPIPTGGANARPDKAKGAHVTALAGAVAQAAAYWSPHAMTQKPTISRIHAIISSVRPFIRRSGRRRKRTDASRCRLTNNLRCHNSVS